MTTYSFDVAPFGKLYIDSIVAEMTHLFGISEEEAIGRVNRHWRGVRLVEQEDIDGLTAELPDYWAKRVYYGPNAKRWLGENGLNALPYP